MSHAPTEFMPEESELWYQGQKLAFFMLTLTLTACLFDWCLSGVAGLLDRTDLISLLLPSMLTFLIFFPSTAHRMATALSFLLDGTVRLAYGFHFAINGVSDFKDQSPTLSLMIGCTLAAIGTAYFAAAIAIVFSTRLKTYLSPRKESGQ